jgi:two-component system chemotaxis response regulator CheB
MPSVDVLFESAASLFGSNALAVILTGMGNDGALGMKLLHDQGAYTITQDESTSVVYGMPKQAFLLGAADKQSQIEDIPYQIIRQCNKH